MYLVCRTSGLSNYWTVGLSGYRIIGLTPKNPGYRSVLHPLLDKHKIDNRRVLVV